MIRWIRMMFLETWSSEVYENKVECQNLKNELIYFLIKFYLHVKQSKFENFEEKKITQEKNESILKLRKLCENWIEWIEKQLK